MTKIAFCLMGLVMALVGLLDVYRYSPWGPYYHTQFFDVALALMSLGLPSSAFFFSLVFSWNGRISNPVLLGQIVISVLFHLANFKLAMHFPWNAISGFVAGAIEIGFAASNLYFSLRVS